MPQGKSHLLNDVKMLKKISTIIMCWINVDWCEALYLIAIVSTYDSSLYNV